jgi:hypothetical protein
MLGIPAGRLAVIVSQVNPQNGAINCGNIIDAVYARLRATNPNATAPTDQDGSFSEIEQRSNTKLDWNSSIQSAFDDVMSGGHGTMGIIGITRHMCGQRTKQI